MFDFRKCVIRLRLALNYIYNEIGLESTAWVTLSLSLYLSNLLRNIPEELTLALFIEFIT
jgi:hypothetical protein